MNYETQPEITSFVLRFVRETVPEDYQEVGYRGAIRHVQSDEELVFTQWKDAVNFIHQFVPINSEDE